MTPRQTSFGEARYRRLRLTIAASVGSKLVRFIAQSIIVAVAIQHLGVTSYGVWVTAVAAMAWLSWGQAGLAPGLANAIAAAEGKEQKGEQGIYFTTALTMIVGIALALYLVGQVLLHLILPIFAEPENSGVSLGGRQGSDWRVFLNIALVLALLRLPLGLIESVFVGLQNVYVLRCFDILGQFLCVCTAVLLVNGEVASAFFLLGVGLAAESGVLCASLYLLVRLRPDLLPTPSKFSLRASRSMFNLSLGYLVIQVTGYMVMNAGTLILAAYHGPVSVPAFALAWQLYQMASGVWMMFVTGLWGALGEARARGEWDWIDRAQRRLILGSMICSVLFSIALAVGGNQLLWWWSGGRIIADPLFLLVMAVNCSVFTWAVVHAQIMSALNRIWVQLWAAAANGLLVLVFGWLLVPTLGATGLALALLSACALSTAWVYPIALARTKKSGGPSHLTT